MGYYINPEDKSKEEWLAENANECTLQLAKDADFHSTFPVILVDNGIFTAAGIAYDKQELEAFTLPNDGRPKRYYLASREALQPFCNALPINER